MNSSEIYEDIKDKIRSLIDELKLVNKQENFKLISGAERQQNEKKISRNVSHVQMLLKDLENEIFHAPMSFRAGMNRELRKFHFELESVERSLKQGNCSTYGRQVSYGRGSSTQFIEPSHHSSEHSNLLAGHKGLQRASESIARSHIVAAESEQIGNGIIQELNEQGEQLVRARDRLESTNNELSRSAKIIRKIRTNVLANKVFLIIFISLELVVLGVIVYFKFFKNHKT